MNLVTIKGHRTDGFVAVEMHDTDTDAVGGFAVNVPDLWRWLWRCRPCRVRVRGRVYSLQPPATHTGRPIPNAHRGTQNWPAN